MPNPSLMSTKLVLKITGKMFKNQINPVYLIGAIILSAGLPFFGIFLDEYLRRFDINRIFKEPDQMVLCSLWLIFFISGIFTLLKFKFMRVSLLFIGHLVFAAWLAFLSYTATQNQISQRDFLFFALPLSVTLLSIILPGVLLLSNVGVKSSFGLSTNSNLNFYHNNFNINLILGVFLLGSPLGILFVSLYEQLRFNRSFRLEEILIIGICVSLILAGISSLIRSYKGTGISITFLGMSILFWISLLAEIADNARQIWGMLGFTAFGVCISLCSILLLNNTLLKEEHEKHLNSKESLDDILDI